MLPSELQITGIIQSMCKIYISWLYC